MVTKVLNGLLYRIYEMYLDDFIVYATSKEESLERLDEVFQRFRAGGLLLKVKKCKFGMAQIEYIGRVVYRPLTSLVQQKVSKRALVLWNPDATKAFHMLKVAISNCPLMFFLDDTSPIRLYTD